MSPNQMDPPDDVRANVHERQGSRTGFGELPEPAGSGRAGAPQARTNQKTCLVVDTMALVIQSIANVPDRDEPQSLVEPSSTLPRQCRWLELKFY